MAETAIVVAGRFGALGRTLLSGFLDRHSIDTLEFDERHWPVALDALVRYGKGRHPAALNFGDCLSYATAKVAGEPLLCTGNDFPQTDLDVVAL